MTTICAPSAFPSYNSIRNSVNGLFPQTPFGPPGLTISLPTMPAMPSITWPESISPGLQIEMFANQLQSFQTLSVMSAAYETLSSVVSLPLPPIPSISGANLDTLLQLNPNGLLNGFSTVSVRGLYQNLDWPEMERLSALQIAIGEYKSVMIDFLFDLANQVADALVVSPLSALPDIPSAQSIFDGISRSVSFPGFSIDLSFPSPLIPDFVFPDYEVGQILKMIMNSLPTALMSIITDFITDVLQLPLTLPVICLPISLANL